MIGAARTVVSAPELLEGLLDVVAERQRELRLNIVVLYALTAHWRGFQNSLA